MNFNTQLLHDGVVKDACGATITYFEENAKPSERFRKTLERLGVDGLKDKIVEAYNG